MLQRLLTSLDELDHNGLWSRDQLEAMDAAFTSAMERAFAAGHESSAAAAATAQLKASSRLLAEEAALAAVWNWFVSVKFDATANEIVARVRAGCPTVSSERVRQEFRKRLFGSNGVVVRANDGPGTAPAALDKLRPRLRPKLRLK